jgi:hypothetical protein
MNTKNMPGFTAEASLYNGKARYTGRYRQEALGEQRGELQRTVVIPQVRGPDAPNPGDCFSDCRDTHPDWTAARCRASCRDPVGTIPVGSRVGYGPFCEDSPPDECNIGFVACCLASDPFTCAFICSDYKEVCLEDSRRECLIATLGPP